MMSLTPQSSTPSAWTPFRQRSFAILWLATLLSNIGTWMHDVGAGWLMTELSPSPLLVAAVQAATTLPIFLFALPAGALADILDKRSVLIVINVAMGAVAGLLAVFVAFDAVTPTLLLLVTVLMGTGTAFMAPAWQAVVPLLVPKNQLSQAVSLNSVGINLSRAIGPAVAGFLIVAYGLVWPFVVNALSVVGIIAALIWWHPPVAKKSSLPMEPPLRAIEAGLKYAASSDPLKSTLIRAVSFFLFASAFWALLPLIVKTVIGGEAGLYGVLLGAIGTGAVLGALVLPSIKRYLGPDRTVACGTAGIAVVMFFIAVLPNAYASLFGALFAGLCWIAVLSTLNVSAQTSLPDWVRARGLSIFLMGFFGSMTVGSLVWGYAASQLGVSSALVIASVGAILAIPLTFRAKLNRAEGVDLSPSMHWPTPLVDRTTEGEARAVMVQVSYEIEAHDKKKFFDLMSELAKGRRKNGAMNWHLMQDSEDSKKFVEVWYEHSWLQHLRHHERVGAEVKKTQEAIGGLHAGTMPPVVRHFITAF